MLQDDLPEGFVLMPGPGGNQQSERASKSVLNPDWSAEFPKLFQFFHEAFAVQQVKYIN